MSKIDESIIQATKEGRLYFKTADFLKDDIVKATIAKLEKSDIIKRIRERKESKHSLEKAQK